MSLDVTLFTEIEGQDVSLHWQNITHNLGPMAEAAGIYDVCWHPESNAVSKAGDMIECLELGLEKLKSQPNKFKEYNSPNGWGLYENFVPWVEEYLLACKKFPSAKVRVSR